MNCPPPALWFKIAAGLLPSTEVVPYLNHAGHCGDCATHLENAMEDLAADAPSPELQRSLMSTQRGWQEDLAWKLDLQSKQKPPDSASSTAVVSKHKRGAVMFRLTRRIYTAATLVMAVVAGVFFYLQPVSPDILIARAYIQPRTLDLRITPTAYSPVHVRRGAAASRVNRTPALIEAELTIKRELAKQPDNSNLLQAEGRVELLQWNYHDAIRAFERALEIEPSTPSLKLDLAIAHFENAASTSGRNIDYTKAYQLLGEVLAKNPDDPIALFNRAIVSDRLFFYSQAILDWKHYLELDSKGEWAAEAKQRLSDASDKVKDYDRKRAEPLLTPAEFVRSVSPTDESTWPAVDQRIEEYLDSAVREWLPKAFPAERTEKPALTAQAALRRLALVLERRHDDLWLTNMIQERPSRTFSLAVLHLSNSVEKDKGGDADRARTEASEAIRLFSQSENFPGAIRAQLELVYALHRASQGGACLKAAAPIQRTLPGRRYSWIEAQLLLEKAVCFRITDDLKETDLAITAARKKADEAKFDSMALRAVGFQASLEWSAKGNEPLAWSLYYKGLSDFWAGNYPEMRAYQFYSDLCAPAENHGHWQLALGCSAEAAILTARMDDLSLKALAHFRVSRAALMAGQSARSKIELEKAEKAFEALPSGPAKETYRLDTEIRNAGIESAQGDPALALDRLNKLEAQAQDISNDFMAQNYFQELGDVEKKLGEMKLAQQSYRAAIEKAEKGFSKLNNKRDRRGWQRLADAAYRGLAESQSRDNQTTEALETWESYRALPLHEPASARQEARTSPTAKTPASVEVSLLAPFSVRQGLPLLRHETLISYAIFPNGLAIWAYDDRGITSKMVPVSADELERAVRRFNEQCADPESDIAMLQQNGKRLYQWLIAPVESFLESSRQIVVEPDGILGEVAIQALVDSRDEYFGARYSLVFTPSLAHYFQALKAKNPGADSPALVVGSSLVPNDYAGMLQPLPDAILESQIVGKILSRSKVMDAQDLTAEMLLQKLAHVEIFHFAGHAITTADGVRLVLTAPGGEARFIDADLFRRTEFKNLRLVVLSACSTAHGGETEDGFGNLIEALLETGVPRAIGSYWDVDSKITVMLIQRLYQGIAEGKRVPLALHEALSRGREVNKHPYYWATFHVWV